MPQLHRGFAIAVFLAVERALRPLKPVSPLPPALLGMFGSFGLLLAIRKFLGADAATRLFRTMEPGYRTLVKWATCFFVPALMALPVAVAAEADLFTSPVVGLKVLGLIGIAFVSSIWVTGKVTVAFGTLFGTDKIHFRLSGVARSWSVRGQGKRSPGDAELLRLLRTDPRGSLDKVLEQVPAALKEDVYSKSFVDGVARRYKELDTDELDGLSPEEVLPIVVSLTKQSAQGRGLSEDAEQEMADVIVERFSSDGKSLSPEDFLFFARVLAAGAYLGEVGGFKRIDEAEASAGVADAVASGKLLKVDEEGRYRFAPNGPPCGIGSKDTTTPAAAASSTATPAAVAAKKPAAPKRARAYDPRLLKVHGTVMGAALAVQLMATLSPAMLGGTAKAASLVPLAEACYMICAVFSGFIIGENLPGSWPQVVHPMLTCVAFSYAAGAVWGSASGTSLMHVLENFGSPLGGGGGFMLPMLQPLIISLGMSLYERRTVLFEDLWVILCTGFVTAIFGMFGTAIIAGPILRLPAALVLSAIPRSVTAALALAIMTMLGPPGNSSFAIALVQVFGLLGAAVGLRLMKLWTWRSPLQRGLAMGATSAGLGTVSLAGEDPEAFGYSAVMFAVVGAIATSIVAVPPARKLLLRIAFCGAA